MTVKKLVGLVVVPLVAGLGALAWSFTACPLPVDDGGAVAVPAADPPAEMSLAVLHTGKMLSQAGFAYRGGALGEPRVFTMSAVLVRHPKGRVLIDAGFSRAVDRHVETIPALMRATSTYEKETPAADQLAAAGIDPRSLAGVILTHAHWDHVSGLADLPGVPVLVNAAELDFIRGGDEATALAASLGDLPYRRYEFDGGPYLGFERSVDFFGDGSLVLVPAPGHTPGSAIAFVALPSGQRYAFVGDLVWQKEGVEIPAERPWLSRQLVDHDAAGVRRWIVHLHRLQRLVPDLIVVPAHDRRVMETLPPLVAVAAAG